MNTTRKLFRIIGETFFQIVIFIIITYFLERMDFFQIYVSSYNQNVIWIPELAVGLGIILAISLIINNTIFSKLNTSTDWFYKAIAEGITIIPIFLLISFLFSSIILFDFSSSILFYYILFLSVFIISLIFNRATI